MRFWAVFRKTAQKRMVANYSAEVTSMNYELTLRTAGGGSRRVWRLAPLILNL